MNRRYWKKQFATFDRNDGRFVPTWSWWAFIFGPLWYAWKGLWGKVVLIFAALCLLHHAPASFVLFWIYPALFAKWDFYLLQKRETHFW